MRTFISINFSDKIKEQIKAVVEKIGEYSVRGHFSSEEHLHLTLEFLGELDSRKAEEVKRILNNLKFETFSIRAKKIGCFQGRDGNTYWLGLTGSSNLYEVQKRLHDALVNRGFSLEDRGYKPHITLGRQIQLRSGCSLETINSNEDLVSLISGIEIAAERVDLMKSERINGRLIHSILHSAVAGSNEHP